MKAVITIHSFRFSAACLTKQTNLNSCLFTCKMSILVRTTYLPTIIIKINVSISTINTTRSWISADLCLLTWQSASQPPRYIASVPIYTSGPMLFGKDLADIHFRLVCILYIHTNKNINIHTNKLTYTHKNEHTYIQRYLHIYIHI